MKIGMMRHASVIYKKSFFTTGKLFIDAISTYNSSPISTVTTKISSIDFPVCYVSSMNRAIETAKMVYDGEYIITDELVEVKNTAFFLQKIKIPAILRSIIGRIAWFFNYQKMPETRKETTERAGRFINLILKQKSQNILLITHGFFMHSLKKELSKHGFKGYLPFFPRNGFLYLFKNKN
jgi:broad specificity phosphatase PhoE